VIDAGKMDGDGFALEDINADGGAELVGIDNSFLYAFASYAESNAPTRIKKLIGGELKDVTQEPAYRRYLRQQVLAMEATASPGSWHSNGFLAAWVAAKALIGEGVEAWSRMLLNYDRNSDWELAECTVPLPLDECPDEGRRKIDFPAALKNLLTANGYSIPGVTGGLHSVQ
jgi:hypothetical protein